MNKKISLLEALTGFNFEIKHLDGTKILIAPEQGEIINNLDIRKIFHEKSLGEPRFSSNTGKFGLSGSKSYQNYRTLRNPRKQFFVIICGIVENLILQKSHLSS